MTFKILYFIGLVALLAVTAPAQERFVKPVDEAKMDASFAAFRTKLISAAERRDSAFILKIIDPNIKLSFGGDEGIEDFHRMWKIEDKNSVFWAEFLPVIKNGGSFVRDGKKRLNLFYAPYSFSSFPDDLETFEYALIIGKGVNLRNKPSMDGAVVGTLSYTVVKPHYDPEGSDNDKTSPTAWVRVETLGGKTGYVSAQYVRSPIDYRAGFEKKRGAWQMVTFIAGD